MRADWSRAAAAARRLLDEIERSPGRQETAADLAESCVREAERCVVEVAAALGRPGEAVALRARLVAGS